MKENKDFYVGYIDSVAPKTKKTIKGFVLAAFAILLAIAAIFAFTQNTAKNSYFEFGVDTKITGIYHELPYPMLQVKTEENEYRNIVLLGFGKFSANPYLKKIRNTTKPLSGSTLSIEGNLIYYNGKTLIQITDEEKVVLVTPSDAAKIPQPIAMVQDMELQGEIIDPKCYFGVMKPGKGKIHRSCAVLCISGGIPPVLATTDENNISKYYLITDTNGAPIHQDILPFVGKPSVIQGDVYQLQDWYQLRIDVSDIQDLNQPSTIY